MDPYQVLGVSQSASRAEVRAAYHRLARRWHPDFFAAPGQEQARAAAEAAMKSVNAAYRMLAAGGAEKAPSSPPPPPPSPPPPPPRPPVCPRHAADRVYRCAGCGAPACAGCLADRRCPGCPTPSTRQADPREWGWLIALGGGLVAMHQLEWSPPATLGAVAAYLGVMGAGLLRRASGWARLLWLLAPYSLVALGLVRLARPLAGSGR